MFAPAVLSEPPLIQEMRATTAGHLPLAALLATPQFSKIVHHLCPKIETMTPRGRRLLPVSTSRP
jgi:hypothetical protein